MSLRISTLDPRAEHALVAEHWAALAARAGSMELAHDFEWFCSNLDWLSPRDRGLRILVVSRGDEPLAMLPVETRRVRLGPVSTRALGFVDHPAAPAGTAVLVSTAADVVGEAFVAHLADRFKGWRCLSLEGLEVGSTWERALRSRLGPQCIAVEREPVPQCFLEFRGSWEEFLATRSAKLREQIRQQQRRLRHLGCTYSDHSGDAVAGIDVIEQVDRESWRADRPATWEKNESLLRYCRGLLRTYPRADAHMARSLTLDGRPIAGWYAFRHGRVLYNIKWTYDRAYAPRSPGLVLLVDVYKECFGTDLDRIEFLAHNRPVRRMTNASRQVSRTLLFNRASSGLALGAIFRLALGLKRRWRVWHPGEEG